MRKAIVSILAAGLLVVIGVGSCFTTGAAENICGQETVEFPAALLADTGIRAIIVDQNGIPAEGISVTAFNILGLLSPQKAFAYGTTDSNGHAILSVPEGRYTVIAGKLGYGGAAAFPVMVYDGQLTDVRLSLTGPIIPGSVPSAQVQSPEVIFEPSLQQQTMVTDPVTNPVTMPEDVVDSKIEMAGTGTIQGMVTDQNGNPIAGARIVAVGDPDDPNTQFGVTISHLFLGEKGFYSMDVPAGRYVFLRAAKLPFYIGAWTVGFYVDEGVTIIRDLSMTYIGPGLVVSTPASSQQSTVIENTCITVVKTVGVNANQI